MAILSEIQRELGLRKKKRRRGKKRHGRSNGKGRFTKR